MTATDAVPGGGTELAMCAGGVVRMDAMSAITVRIVTTGKINITAMVVIVTMGTKKSRVTWKDRV